jgi:catechol 2,3-dioxygenase-like lactoylglutathione lyase family enzyme
MWVLFAVLAASNFTWCAEAVTAAESPGRITGIGGIFVVSKNPKALTAWYRDVLGISLAPWGGATFRYDATGHPPVTLWDAFPRGASEFAHSRRDFMLNLAVDDLNAFLTRLKAKGVTIIKRESDSYGKFASILDPDGTKIELWQPMKR